MIRRTAAWLLVATIGGGPGMAAAQTAADAAVVVIERDTAAGWWTATWKLDTPTAELRFDRPANGFRNAVFEPVTPGTSIVREGDIEVLRAGTPIREVRVRFPEYDRPMVRDYEFFRRFTDGGVAIYTGHLVARPSGGSGARQSVQRFRFVPPEGHAVIVAGRRSREPVEWSDAGGRGTYAYIGPADPVETADVISVIDPGLPDWLRRRTAEFLPRLFALYADRLGVRPADRPVVLFDYREGTGDGYSNGGGTLPGLIQLSVEGLAWRNESPAALIRLVHFLAHEAAHVWNGEIAHYPGSDDAWMHEGSADAMAQRALVELRIIDEAAFLDHQTEALNDCRLGLGATPLRESLRRNRSRMAYTCGNVIALLTEQSLADNGRDLFDFWRELIARATAGNGEYDANDYLAIYRSMGGTVQDAALLGAFLDGSMTADRLAAALDGNDVRTVEAEPPPEYGSALLRDVMMFLMPIDCGGRIGFTTTSAGIVLDADVRCSSFPAGATVVAFGGHRFDSAPGNAYDHVRTQCATAGAAAVAVRVDGSPGEVSVRCTAGLPPRPAYLRITERRPGR